MMPKLAIDIRVHFDATGPGPENISSHAVLTDGKTLEPSTWSKEFLAGAFKETIETGHTLVGLVGKAVLSPVILSQTGMILVKVVIDGTEIVAGKFLK